MPDESQCWIIKLLLSSLASLTNMNHGIMFKYHGKLTKFTLKGKSCKNNCNAYSSHPNTFILPFISVVADFICKHYLCGLGETTQRLEKTMEEQRRQESVVTDSPSDLLEDPTE